MDDLYDQTPDGGSQDQGGPPSDEPVKIGDREYSRDQLSELINKGEYASRIEREQNIDIKELYPEYTRSRQQIREFENQVDSQYDEPDDPDVGGEDFYEDENIKKFEARLNRIEQSLTAKEQGQYQREIERDLSSLEEKHGIRLNPAEKEHVFKIALLDRNMDLGEAMEIFKLKKERDRLDKERARGLGGSGQSPAQGIRKYDPKKSMQENLQEAKEDFLRLRKS